MSSGNPILSEFYPTYGNESFQMLTVTGQMSGIDLEWHYQ
jgi:hypothetical protein